MKIALCGSAKFEQQFHEWDEQLALAGHITYSLAVYPSSKEGNKDWYDDAQKQTLDLVHLAKIEESDAIVVLNHFLEDGIKSRPGPVQGYIGFSTAREIEWAKIRGKQVYYLNPPTGHLNATFLLIR